MFSHAPTILPHLLLLPLFRCFRCCGLGILTSLKRSGQTVFWRWLPPNRRCCLRGRATPFPFGCEPVRETTSSAQCPTLAPCAGKAVLSPMRLHMTWFDASGSRRKRRMTRPPLNSRSLRFWTRRGMQSSLRPSSTSKSAYSLGPLFITAYGQPLILRT